MKVADNNNVGSHICDTNIGCLVCFTHSEQPKFVFQLGGESLKMGVSFENFLKQLKNSKNTKSYHDYSISNSAEYSIDALVRLMIQPVIDKNPKINNLLAELNGEGIQYRCLNIQRDESNKEVEVYENGRRFWKTVDDYLTAAPLLDKPLSKKDSQKYPGYIGSTGTSVLYNPSTSKLLKKGKSELYQLGMLYMKSATKGDWNAKPYTETIALKDIYTTRSNKAIKELQSASFIGSISRVSEPKTPYYSNSKNPQYQIRDAIAGSPRMNGYYLADCYVVLDIDNGAQINKIIKIFSKMPECLIPQIIIQEKGFEGTKRGNASAIIAFDRPLTSTERHTIINGVRRYIACEGNVFAIDSKCTGFNLFKNPLKLYKGQLQRMTRVHNNTSARDLSDALNMAGQYINKFENLYSDDAEKFIINNNLKYTTLSYSQLLKKYSKQNPIKPTVNANPINGEDDIVNVGERNNTLVRELSAMLLQEYNRIGFVSAFQDPSTPGRVLNAIWQDIQTNYENSDNEYSWKRCYSIIKWAYNRDKQLYNSDNEKAKLQLFINTSKQRKYMLKDGKCQLMDAYGLKCMNNDNLAEIPELEGIYIKKASSSRSQILHGAETNLLKGIVYLFASYEGNLLRESIKLKRYARVNNLDLQNYSHLERLNNAARTLLYENCNERFTPNKAEELANYLCLYISACQRIVSKKENIKIEVPQKVFNEKEDKTGFFRLTRSAHFLYDSVKYSKAIKSLLELLIAYNRENGEYRPIEYKDISRKTSINKIFAYCWEEYNIDWSTCAISLSYIHRNTLANKPILVNIQCLHAYWVDTIVKYLSNIYISTKVYAEVDSEYLQNCNLPDSMFSMELWDKDKLFKYEQYETGEVFRRSSWKYNCMKEEGRKFLIPLRDNIPTKAYRITNIPQIIHKVLNLGKGLITSEYFNTEIKNRAKYLCNYINKLEEEMKERKAFKYIPASQFEAIRKIEHKIYQCSYTDIEINNDIQNENDGRSSLNLVSYDNYYNGKILFNEDKMDDIAIVA